MKEDHRSYIRNFCSFEKKAWFEPLTSAIPVQSSHWLPMEQRVIFKLILTPASYPDVSLSMKMCAQRKAGRRHPSHGPLRFITSHSFRARLCHAKNEAPEEEAILTPQYLSSLLTLYAPKRSLRSATKNRRSIPRSNLSTYINGDRDNNNNNTLFHLIIYKK